LRKFITNITKTTTNPIQRLSLYITTKHKNSTLTVPELEQQTKPISHRFKSKKQKPLKITYAWWKISTEEDPDAKKQRNIEKTKSRQEISIVEGSAASVISRMR